VFPRDSHFGHPAMEIAEAHRLPVEFTFTRSSRTVQALAPFRPLRAVSPRPSVSGSVMGTYI